MVKWLVDIQVDEVSLVDKAANKRKFAFIKRVEQSEQKPIDEAAKKEAVVETKETAEAEAKQKAEAEAKAAAEQAEMQELESLLNDAKQLIEMIRQL